MAEYRTALARYVPGGILASASEGAWVTGKMMEVLAPALPDGPVTRADFLKALYALRGETLGGLVPPLTYREGQSHDAANLCIYPIKVQGGKFVPQGGLACPPGWKPVA